MVIQSPGDIELGTDETLQFPLNSMVYFADQIAYSVGGKQNIYTVHPTRQEAK